MAKKTQLQASIRQMAEGSKSAFHTFYTGTSQYVYRNVSLLYPNHTQVCQFMVDFYQYLYLHVPEYTPSTELKVWIMQLIRARYDELSIGRNQQTPDLSQQLESGNSLLSASEQEHIWRQLEACMHFPAETKETNSSKPRTLTVIILVLILFTLSAAFTLALTQYSRLQNQPADQEALTDASPSEASENDEPSEAKDEDTITVEDLNDLLENAANQSQAPESQDDAEFEDPAMSTQHSAARNEQSEKENEPAAAGPGPDTSKNRDSGSTTKQSTNIEDLELKLHYGENLVNPGMLSD